MTSEQVVLELGPCGTFTSNQVALWLHGRHSYVMDGLMVAWEGSSKAEPVSLGQREPSAKVRCGLSQTVQTLLGLKVFGPGPQEPGQEML